MLSLQETLLGCISEMPGNLTNISIVYNILLIGSSQMTKSDLLSQDMHKHNQMTRLLTLTVQRVCNLSECMENSYYANRLTHKDI
jgi:hypothetical protein